LNRLLAGRTEPLSETVEGRTGTAENQAAENIRGKIWWAHLDSNQGPTGYEPVALTKLSYGPKHRECQSINDAGA
jgi:hypothetical protein